RVLLRRRLLHVWIVFSVGLLALLIYCWAGIGEAMVYGATPALGGALNGLLFLNGVTSTVFLWRNPGVRLRTLRWLELAGFAGVLLVLGVFWLNTFLAYSAESPDPRWPQVAAERIGIISIVPFFFALTFYGVYIPNTRRRSLLVVVVGAAVPIVALGLAAVLNPAIRPFVPFIL